MTPQVLATAGPDDNLPWRTTAATVEAESGLPNPPAAPGNAIFVNNGTINFISGNIDLRGVDNSQVTANVDLRTFQDSTSGFEAVDTIDAFIEGSTDGIFFTRIATIETLAGDGDGVINNGEMDLLEQPGGAYTTFTSTPGAIPADILSIRVVVTAVNNSASERFYLDNVAVGSSIGPPPPFIANIVRNQVTGQNTITWTTDGVSLYTLFYSSRDLSGWTFIASDINLSSFNHTPPPGDTEGFYYVTQELD